MPTRERRLAVKDPIRSARRKTHGMADTPTYASWTQMIQRCMRSTNPSYPRYGGRGITICARWMKFPEFLADMGVRPEGKTLERETNSGNYEPGNCKWATPKEQARNRRSSRNILIFGETKTLAAWGEDSRCRVRARTFEARILKGWDAETALVSPNVPSSAKLFGRKIYEVRQC